MKIKLTKIPLIFLIIAYMLSCNPTKSTNYGFTKIIDKKNKFTVDIPKNWSVELDENEWSSMVIFSDTTRNLDSLLVYSILWDSSRIYLNDHFQKSLDSIVKTFGQEPNNQEFKSLNDFETYCFNTTGFDSLNQITFYDTHYYLKQTKKTGSLKFTVSRSKQKSNKNDSILTNKILNSIKRN